MRVWNTRADAQKIQKTSNPISDLIINKITEYATDNTSTHEQNPTQLKALNKKVLGHTHVWIEHSVQGGTQIFWFEYF